MNIQIFGRKDCSDTRKAERFFKEHGIKFQFVDLKEKGFSKRELESVAQKTGWEKLIDREGKRFREKGMHVMHPAQHQRLILEDSLLCKTPVVRNAPLATVGFEPEVWKIWFQNPSK